MKLKVLCDVFYKYNFVAIRHACDDMQTLLVFNNGMQHFFYSSFNCMMEMCVKYLL